MTVAKPRVANPIAVRRYGVAAEPEREIVVTLGRPRPDPDPTGDWRCTVLIEGLPGARRRRIHGIDALQALQLAILYVRKTLDASGLTLTWFAAEPGDVGIPRTVPDFYGLAFAHEIERHIDRQVARFAPAEAKTRTRRGRI